MGLNFTCINSSIKTCAYVLIILIIDSNVMISHKGFNTKYKYIIMTSLRIL